MAQGGVVDAIDTAVGAVDTDVVVVGHSLSGLCLPSIATVHPPHGVRGWATARASILRRTPRHRTGGDHLSFARTRWYRADGFDVGVGARRLLPRLPEDVAREAFNHMRRQSFTPFVETCPVERWPQTPATYILMRDDRAVSTSWVRWHAVHRIGATVLELDGGHSPFFAQPVRLARALIAASG